MTEQELRDKIIKALKHGGDLFHGYFMRSLNDAKESGKTHFGSKDCDKSMYDFFADALIEAGLKFDVNYSFTAAFNSVQIEREKALERRLAYAEYRAEVAEAELSRYTEMIARDDIYSRAERVEKERDTYKRAIEIAEELGELCAPIDYYVKQAEKELQEGKDDR